MLMNNEGDVFKDPIGSCVRHHFEGKKEKSENVRLRALCGDKAGGVPRKDSVMCEVQQAEGRGGCDERGNFRLPEVKLWSREL